MVLLKLACGSTKIPHMLSDTKKKKKTLIELENTEKAKKCGKCGS